MIIECIKEGINITHRNWQLIIVRIITALINVSALVVFFGVPLLVAIMYLGMDIMHAKEILHSFVTDPSRIFTKYIGLLFAFIAAVLFFLTFTSLLLIYTLGGTIGVLVTSALNAGYKFSTASFFSEANKNFARLFRLLSLLFLGITLMLAAFLVFAGVGIAIVHSLAVSQSTLLVFLSTFIMLSGITFGSLLIFAAIVFIFYSTITSVAEERKSVESIKWTFDFLKSRPDAFLLFLILFAGLIAANVMMMPVSWMTVLFPLIGTLIQSYLMIILWSSLIVSYIKRRRSSIEGKYNII